MSSFRFAIRQLAKSPGFTIVAVSIVALGIGAATTMFSTVNALVLRPIALPDADRLYAIYENNLSRNLQFYDVSVRNYEEWKNRAQSWESLAAKNWRARNLTGDGEPEYIRVTNITASFLPTLGIPTMLGRNFLAEEDRPGGARVAILSAEFWQRRYGGEPDIIGRIVHLDHEPYTVVGITAAGQPLPDDLEVAIPLAADVASRERMAVFGRLKAGVTPDQADAELKAIAAQVATELPATEQGWSTRLVPFAREIVGEGIRTGLYVLLGAVGLLLLIACANLSNLILVRASARAHEIAIRTALGASRGQVIRHILTESLVVTLTGGMLGMLASLWAVDLMQALPLPRAGEISVDFRVLSAALVATVMAGLLSGLGPALRTSLVQPQEALKDRSPRSGHRSRLRDFMVVAQLAISLTLLVGATLLGQSLLRLLRVDPGFNYENVLTISLRPAGDPIQFYERLTERLAHLPGVTHTGLISSLPLTEGNTSMNVVPQGESAMPAGASIHASWRLVDGGYFDAMQIPLIRGRTLAGLTPDEAHRSVVISAKLAQLLWGDADPIGRQLDPRGSYRPLLTVVGVVGDVRAQKLAGKSTPDFYLSMHGIIYGPMHLVVRSDQNVAALLASIRAVANEIDPTVPLIRTRTLEQIRATNLGQERLILSLLGGFTAIALFLAALGTYGVVAFGVQQRTREIGIRLAIGAQYGDILRLVVGQGAQLMTFGIVLGLAGSLAAARVLRALLYETGAVDLWSYAVATLILALVALGACLLPARRATKVDPLAALRAE